ncbi:MAG: hypothetical protein KTR14_04500 [Vampirovibrio sp.]|nr:hypothetical protein [Vampirovibrio sp.]
MRIVTQRLQHWYRKLSDLNWVFADQALVSGVNFLTGILLARFLGIDDFGRFTLIWMVVLFVNAIQYAQTVSPMMSIGPKLSGAEASQFYGATLVQSLALLMVFLLVIYIGCTVCESFFPQGQIEKLMTPLLLVVTAFQCQDLIRRLFFTQGKVVLAFINDLISYIGQIIVLSVLYAGQLLQTETALLAIAGTSALAVLVGTFFLPELSFNKASMKPSLIRNWHFSKWLTASAMMQWIGGNFFVAVSGAYLSVSAAGAIAAARNVVGPTLVLFMALENIVPVKASKEFQTGHLQALKRYLVQVSVWGGGASLLVCLVAALFAPFWMEWLFGADYVQYAYLVYWFSITHFLMFFIRPLNSYLRTIELTQPIATASIIPMVFSLVASIPLVQYFGLTGAMIVMLTTQVLILGFLTYSAFGHGKRVLA